MAFPRGRIAYLDTGAGKISEQPGLKAVLRGAALRDTASLSKMGSCK
jgi:hypothetical protein